MCARIVVGGPPHSGKSVFLWALKKALPIGSYMPVRAAPDGEGDWTQDLYASNGDLAQELRVKGSFTEEFIVWAAESVRNCTSRFGLIDIGGRVTDENRRICKDADTLIILSSDQNRIQEWQKFAADLGLKVLAIIHSTLDSVEEWDRVSDDGIFEGLAVNLDREDFEKSGTITNLAKFLLSTTTPEEGKKMNITNTLTIAAIAAMINKSEEDYMVGDRAVHGLNWRPTDLPAVEAALKALSATGMTWVIDGPGPQWLIVAITHALHPCPVTLTDTKVAGGLVPIGQRKATVEGGGSGDLDFTVEEKEMGALVRYSSQNPIAAQLLPELIPPTTPTGQPVFLNGRTATWAVAEITGVYQHVVPAVYVGQPVGKGYMYVCAISHSTDHKVGSVVLDTDLR